MFPQRCAGVLGHLPFLFIGSLLGPPGPGISQHTKAASCEEVATSLTKHSTHERETVEEVIGHGCLRHDEAGLLPVRVSVNAVAPE